MMLEKDKRKLDMQTSNWIAAAPDATYEFIPVSSHPLDASYQRSHSATRAEFHDRTKLNMMRNDVVPPAPAANFIANRYAPPVAAQGGRWGTFGASIVLGSDESDMLTSSKKYGSTFDAPQERVDLTRTIPSLRDATLDGAHRASMTERHFMNIHDPYVTDMPDHHVRAASFKSGYQLRKNYHRHVRSQYHPDEKYFLPPTVQNDIGWKIADKYESACAKYQDGAAWHGRQGSHITKFSERLLLGARHHLSGPMTNPKLHY